VRSTAIIFLDLLRAEGSLQRQKRFKGRPALTLFLTPRATWKGRAGGEKGRYRVAGGGEEGGWEEREKEEEKNRGRENREGWVGR